MKPEGSNYGVPTYTNSLGDDGQKTNMEMLLRRHILLGLLWLSAAGGATAKPIEPPDFSKCHEPTFPPPVLHINCCPPNSPKIVDYELPPPPKTPRVRRPAHLLDEAYIEKYSKAVSLIKSLPSGHPWNFIMQANTHCSYCDGVFNQTSYPNRSVEIHGCWLFLVFHRAFVYFQEKIIGKLIGDDTFAFPYWNWDAPEGMIIPPIYDNASSPLYYADRDRRGNDLLDLRVQTSFDREFTREEQISSNLELMYRHMVTGSKTVKLFLGSPYRAGDDMMPGLGSIEWIPHASVHGWTGGVMPTFYQAARDPIFFAHHGNMDRLWELWKRSRRAQGKPTAFDDPDWLDSAFLFWDENLRLVRVRVRDFIDADKLGYVYQDMPLPWLHYKKSGKLGMHDMTAASFCASNLLNDAQIFKIKKPPMLKGIGDQGAEEVLVIDGIQFDRTLRIIFVVYISTMTCNASATAAPMLYVHTFINTPMGLWRSGGRNEPLMTTTRMTLGVSDLLAQLEPDGGDDLVVTLVPKTEEKVTMIGRVWIELDDDDVTYSS